MEYKESKRGITSTYCQATRCALVGGAIFTPIVVVTVTYFRRRTGLVLSGPVGLEEAQVSVVLASAGAKSELAVLGGREEVKVLV